VAAIPASRADPPFGQCSPVLPHDPRAEFAPPARVAKIRAYGATTIGGGRYAKAQEACDPHVTEKRRHAPSLASGSALPSATPTSISPRSWRKGGGRGDMS
jgi:hypothetical protein